MALSIFTLFLFLFFQLAYSADQQNYTSLFSFGDSLADTGNFLNSGAQFFNSINSINNLPYGMTYFRHATGRCSDGRLVVDFIAEALGLPMLPPYLAKSKDFRQGVNFAVAGSTALDSSFFREIGAEFLLWTNLSLSMQLAWFQELKPSLCNTSKGCITLTSHSPNLQYAGFLCNSHGKKSADCSAYFSKSLFLVGEIGGNDYNYAFFSGRSIEQVTTYVPRVIDIIVTSAQKLIDEGAVNLMVPGDLPIGCSPMYLTLFASPNEGDYDANGCLKQFNGFAKYYNELLRRALQQLQEKNRQAKISYADYYGAAIRFSNAPKRFGFSNGPLMACCGGGGPYNFNINARCGHRGASSCSDPSSYVNWDGIHLTEAAYRQIANGVLQGPFAEPLPIMRLLSG